MQPFFSVIIPTLEEEEYIPRLLNDLYAQNDKSFEVIVVDGGSKDQTVTQVSEFLDKLPLQIEISPKANVSMQRNLGAAKARGEYLVFFDADARIPPRFLNLIHKYLTNYNRDYLTTYIFADSRNVYDKAVERLINISIEIGLLIDRPFVVGANFMVTKTAFYKVGGFREEIKHSEDYDLAYRLHQAGYSLGILKTPRLVFSLRRYRHEGRLKVLRKNAQAVLHLLTHGQITQDLFDYPMGGAIYRLKQKTQITPLALKKAQLYIRKFITSLWSELK
ncbi:MAG: glycosyltransferase [Patescibacteria group bacterium]